MKARMRTRNLGIWPNDPKPPATVINQDPQITKPGTALVDTPAHSMAYGPNAIAEQMSQVMLARAVAYDKRLNKRLNETIAEVEAEDYVSGDQEFMEYMSSDGGFRFV